MNHKRPFGTLGYGAPPENPITRPNVGVTDIWRRIREREGLTLKRPHEDRPMIRDSIGPSGRPANKYAIIDDYIASRDESWKTSPWTAPDAPGAALKTAGNVSGIVGLLAQIAGKSNPYLAALPIVLDIGGSILGELFPSEEQQFQDEILERRRERSRMYARWELGDFTAQERADITRRNEPMFRQLYGQMAARGVENTPAGQEQLNEAYQNVFFNLQQQAAAALEGMDVNSFNMTSQMMATDPSFAQEFGELAESYWTLQALDQLEGTDSGTTQAMDGVGSSLELLNTLRES